MSAPTARNHGHSYQIKYETNNEGLLLDYDTGIRGEGRALVDFIVVGQSRPSALACRPHGVFDEEKCWSIPEDYHPEVCVAIGTMQRWRHRRWR